MATDDGAKRRSQSTGKRIAIFGGTFDPIHYTHLHIAEVVKEDCRLDEIWFMPANQPPHKQGKAISAGEDRIQMIAGAIQGISYFKLCLIEFEREGPSYTIDTIKRLVQNYPQDQFYFIIGADMVEYLPKWVKIEELLRLISFVAVGRPGWRLSEETIAKKEIITVDTLPSYASSTMIRKRKEAGQSIRFLVPDSVYQYIEEKRLYE